MALRFFLSLQRLEGRREFWRGSAKNQTYQSAHAWAAGWHEVGPAHCYQRSSTRAGAYVSHVPSFSLEYKLELCGTRNTNKHIFTVKMTHHECVFASREQFQNGRPNSLKRAARIELGGLWGGGRLVSAPKSVLKKQLKNCSSCGHRNSGYVP